MRFSKLFGRIKQIIEASSIAIAGLETIVLKCRFLPPKMVSRNLDTEISACLGCKKIEHYKQKIKKHLLFIPLLV